jgi:transposase
VHRSAGKDRARLLFGAFAKKVRSANFDQAARHALHLQRAQPAESVEAADRNSMPKHCLPARWVKRPATRSLWPKLVRFLDYPELELSNNLAENSMRP